MVSCSVREKGKKIDNDHNALSFGALTVKGGVRVNLARSHRNKPQSVLCCDRSGKFGQFIKMASGGLLCEVPALPKMGHKIETFDFLESLGKSNYA